VAADPGVSCRRIQALTLCLITDRRRLAAALGFPPERARSALLDQLAGAIAGGVDVIQLRERDLDARDYLSLVRDCRRLASTAATRIVVNDRPDVVLAGGADGVHLREAGIDVEAARRLLPARALLIGRSVHDVAGAKRARSADYMIAGSIFATQSKPGASASMRLDGLRAVISVAESCPVWAVGGISANTVRDVMRCGARGIVAIGAFIPMDRPTDLGHAVEKLVLDMRFSFDTSASVS
jgi:thiamine-phosphate pyrophosphorylase